MVDSLKNENQTFKMMGTDFFESVWDQRDRRTDGWPLMERPLLVAGISLFYAFVVTVLGPMYMKDRKPYQLKGLLILYNVIQVILSLIMVIEGGAAGWLTHYSWVCQPVEQDTDPNSTGMRMALMVYLYFINKYIEFFDTIFFVARKKFNQVTTLHVYHHAVMPIQSYLQLRWIPGGHEVFGGFINCCVHVVMYTYYLLAAMGPQMQPYLWWKKYLTTLQLVQFFVCFIHSGIVAFRYVECGYPWQHSMGCIVFLEVPFFYLFYDFYRKTYNTKAAGIKKTAAVENGSSKKTVVAAPHSSNGHSKAQKVD